MSVVGVGQVGFGGAWGWEGVVALALVVENAVYMERAEERLDEGEIDRATLEAAGRRDADAYARVVKHYQGRVARRMGRFARGRGAVEELTQEVFVQAYFSLRGYGFEAPFSHWLNKIGTRVGLKYWEGLKRAPKQVGDEDLDGLEETRGREAAGNAARDALEIVLSKLEPTDRMVIVLMHLEGRSAKEAAELMGRSVTMTKVQAFRARLRLKKIVDGSEELTRMIQEALQ